MQKWILDLMKWVAGAFGSDILVVAKEKLQSVWHRQFLAKNIVILGDKQTGKSTLIMFMTQGTPYVIRDGERKTPNPTAAAAIVDKKFSFQSLRGKGNKIQIPKNRYLGGGLSVLSKKSQNIPFFGAWKLY